MALLALILCLGCLLAVLPALLSSEAARHELLSALRTATGRPASLEVLELSWGRGLALKNLRIGGGAAGEPAALLELQSLRLDFGFDSLWGRKLWLDMELEGLSARYDPAEWPSAEIPPAPARPLAVSLKESLESLRRALKPSHYSGDLRARVALRDVHVLTIMAGKELRVDLPELLLEAKSLRNSPVRLSVSANTLLNGAQLTPLDVQAEVSGLVDQQRLLRPGSARLQLKGYARGLTLDVNGGLDTGLKCELAVTPGELLQALRPVLPPGLPSATGRVALSTQLSLKGQDNLAASLVFSASALTLSNGPLGKRSVGPLECNLLQEAGLDLAAGTLELPGSLTLLKQSKASWLASAQGLGGPTPELSLRMDTLRLDLGEVLRPLRALLPTDLTLAAASLDSGPLTATLRLSDAPGANPSLSARLQDLTLRASGLQTGPARARASVGRAEFRAEALSASLPGSGPGNAEFTLSGSAEDIRIAGPHRASLRRAELERLSVRGQSLALSEAALFGLSGGFDVEMRSSATGLEVAGLLTAPGVTKSQRLRVDLPQEKRLTLALNESRADMPGLRLLRSGKPALELPLAIQAQARELMLSRNAEGTLTPALHEAHLSVLVGQALRADMDASLSESRRLTTKGALALDADKFAPLLAALLPKKSALSGALALDWNLETALPGQASASASPQSLLARLRGLGFLNRAEGVLNLKSLSLDLPLEPKPGKPAETLHLRGLSTPRPLRFTTASGLAESTLTGTLAFGPMAQFPELGALRRPVSGLLTLNAAQQGLRSAQVAQVLTLDGFKLSQNLNLTLDKLDAVLDSATPLDTALGSMDATANFSLATGLDALPQTAATGASGHGSLEFGADLRLSGGRSLTLATRLRSPGLDLRLGPDLTLKGLTSDLALRRRYGLRPGLACPGGAARETATPLSEQVFDLFPGPASPLSPAADFGLRSLYDGQARRSGALAFAALDLRSGPLPLSLRDCALVLDTSGPLPAVQSFRLGLLGGNILGRAGLKGGGGAYSLDADLAFTGIDTGRLLPGSAVKDLGDQAELSGRVSLTLPLTPDPEALLTRLTLRADITKVGPRTLERALYALDPDEQNETIVQQRRLMAIGYPRNLHLRIAYGNLSLSGQVEVKGFRLDIPPIDRLSLANLPIRSQLGPALRPLPALLDALDMLSATSLCRDPARAGRVGKAGQAGFLNLSATPSRQGATP